MTKLAVLSELIRNIKIFYRKMECSDGPRRRVAMTLTPQNKSKVANELQSAASSYERQQSDKLKFQRINRVNHSVLKHRREQQEFHKIFEQIQERKCTFYRMGFKSFEKNRQRKVFGQVLGLSAHQMKGSMFVGELWTNHQNARFLKENKIHMTKVKLIDRLQQLKKECDSHKSESQSQIDVTSSRSLGTIHLCNPLQMSRANSNSMKTIEIQSNLDKITNGLKLLKKTAGKHSLTNKMKYLQNCQQKIDRVERQYFLKMIDLL